MLTSAYDPPNPTLRYLLATVIPSVGLSPPELPWTPTSRGSSLLYDIPYNGGVFHLTLVVGPDGLLTSYDLAREPIRTDT